MYLFNENKLVIGYCSLVKDLYEAQEYAFHTQFAAGKCVSFLMQLAVIALGIVFDPV